MTTTSLDIMTMTIPNSLRTIGPFLEEAQSIMRSKDSGKQKVTIFCIDHALKLVGQFGLSIGKKTIKCITNPVPIDNATYFARYMSNLRKSNINISLGKLILR